MYPYKPTGLRVVNPERYLHCCVVRQPMVDPSIEIQSTRSRKERFLRKLRFFLSIFTAPGIVLHEIAHAYACETCGGMIEDAVLFQLDYPVGYVTCKSPEIYGARLRLGIYPLFANVLFAVVTLSGAYGIVRFFDPGVATISAVVLLLWLTICFAFHALPSEQDIDVVWTSFRDRVRHNPAIIVTAPLVAIIHAAIQGGQIVRVIFTAVLIVGVWAGMDQLATLLL